MTRQLLKIVSFFLLAHSLVANHIFTSGLRVKATNKYTKELGYPGTDYGWMEEKLFVEPHFKTRISVAAVDRDNNTMEEPSSEYFYVWIVTLPGQDVQVLWEGSEIDYTFSTTGVGDVTVLETSESTGEIVRSVSMALVSKYIRRELRNLKPFDREEVFNAMEVIYRTTTSYGQRLYGGDYRDVIYFASAHNEWAGGETCDHLHDGYGFVTQHVALSIMFENAMRAINPTVTLPYWEYSIESNYYESGGLLHMQDKSPLFDDDWFGPINSTDSIVDSGRFSNVRIPKVIGQERALAKHTDMELAVHNSYNLMKGPWNQSPVEYLSRYRNMDGVELDRDQTPSCDNLYTLMNEDTFESFMDYLPYYTHGAMHEIIGGMYAPDLVPYLKKWGWSYDEYYDVAQNLFATLKNLWREGYMTLDDSCNMTTANGTVEEEIFVGCGRSCPNLEEWLATEAGTVKAYNNIYNWVMLGHNIEEKETAKWTHMLRFACNAVNDNFDDGTEVDTAVYYGEMINSNAPFDPLFWPLHTAVQRYLEWRRWNGFASEYWPDGSSLYGANCTGHDRGDILYYADILEAKNNDSIRYTNLDLYNILLPDSEYTMLDTLFDNFRWPLCAAQGYPLELVDANYTAEASIVPPIDGTALNGTILDSSGNGTYWGGANSTDDSTANSTDDSSDGINDDLVA